MFKGGAAKSRNFAAMDAGRVRVMAQRQFNRPFLDKPTAIAALAQLPPETQAGLKKPGKVTPAMLDFKPRRDLVTGSVAFNDAQRGGIAPPSADRLARAATAKPAVVQRYARAVLNLQAKSPSQALVLLGKYAQATDVKAAASKAFGLAELYKPPAERTGIRLASPATGPVASAMPPSGHGEGGRRPGNDFEGERPSRAREGARGPVKSIWRGPAVRGARGAGLRPGVGLVVVDG